MVDDSLPLSISVTLAYSLKPRQVVEKVIVLPVNSTVKDVLNIAKLSDLMSQEGCELGIWGKKTMPTQVLQDLDRIELYRPLKVDPKVARRERFQKQGARTTGLFAKSRVGGKAGY